MKNHSRYLLAGSLILSIASAQASSQCPNGTMVKLTGEINNNAIAVASFVPLGDPPGNVTLGVARLKLFAQGEREHLTCTLLGEPTGLNEVGDVAYDHIVVCDDPAQSELSFRTTLTGRQHFWEEGFPNLLRTRVAEEYCRSSDDGTVFAYQAFTEKAVANSERTTKGVFAGATGSIGVAGCVNIVGGAAEINMMVKGNLCLSNW